VYYFNFSTEESSWERPAEAGPPAPLAGEPDAGSMEIAAVAAADAGAKAASAAASKGLVLPDRKAARRHSVAKALLLQGGGRAPRMLMPMAAIGEDGGTPTPSAALPGSRTSSRKGSIVAKENMGTATSVALWLKVSESEHHLHTAPLPKPPAYSVGPPLSYSQMAAFGADGSVFSIQRHELSSSTCRTRTKAKRAAWI
jgi:hypothetical protein